MLDYITSFLIRTIQHGSYSIVATTSIRSCNHVTEKSDIHPLKILGLKLYHMKKKIGIVSFRKKFWVERDLNPGPNDSDASSLWTIESLRPKLYQFCDSCCVWHKFSSWRRLRSSNLNVTMCWNWKPTKNKTKKISVTNISIYRCYLLSTLRCQRFRIWTEIEPVVQPNWGNI